MVAKKRPNASIVKFPRALKMIEIMMQKLDGNPIAAGAAKLPFTCKKALKQYLKH